MSFNTLNAAQFYDAARQASQFQPATQPADEQGGSGQDFGDVLLQAAQETLNTLEMGEETAMQSIAGKADAHSVVEALATTEMTLQAAITVRNRVVEAYQEILRMPV